MAEVVQLLLKANGTDIKGEPTQKGMGRSPDAIECVQWEFGVTTNREKGTGTATGRRTHQPIRIVKRIDKATPLIAKALVENEKIDAEFRFFRPDPTGDGTTEQFYTVVISGGRVNHIKQFVPDALNPTSTHSPPCEELSFTYDEISWTFEDGGVSHTDSWSGEAVR